MFWWCLTMMSRATAICTAMKSGGLFAVDEEPGKDGKAGRAENRSQRDIAGEKQDHGEEPMAARARQRRGNQEDAEAGGDALAAAEAEPDGEHVSEDGGEGGEGLVRRGTAWRAADDEARKRPARPRRQPLSMSSRKVAAPRPLPPERSTLVAPMLPLPTERMS